MHNPRYFKDKICEELEGASHYLKKAIDMVKTHPEWAKTFRYMAEGEQEHATDLYKMFMELYTSTDEKDKYMESLRDAIMDCFSIHMRKIEDCKATLDMMMHQEDAEPVKSIEAPVISNIMKGISE